MESRGGALWIVIALLAVLGVGIAIFLWSASGKAQSEAQLRAQEAQWGAQADEMHMLRQQNEALRAELDTIRRRR